MEQRVDGSIERGPHSITGTSGPYSIARGIGKVCVASEELREKMVTHRTTVVFSFSFSCIYPSSFSAPSTSETIPER